MSSITGFLFGGNPTPPQPTGADTTTNFPLWLQDATYGTIGAASNLATQPYTPPPFPTVASPSDPTKQAWQQSINNVGNWQPAIGTAGALTLSAADPLSLGTIGSYAGGAGEGIGALGQMLSGGVNQSVQDQIGNYLNPNLDFVSKGIESQLDQNLQNNILPGIQDRYVASGQVASPQQMEAENRATYQTQQALGQALAPVYQGAYQGALNTALGTANTGYNLGQYGYGLGTNTAQGQQQQQQVAGAQFGQLGALNQQLGAADVSSVANAGAGQDAVNQANINSQMQQFNNQQQWPYQNLGFLSNIIHGLPVATTQQTSALSYSPYASYAPSPVQTGVGTALTAASLGSGRTGGFPYQMARGGRVPANVGALSRLAA